MMKAITNPIEAKKVLKEYLRDKSKPAITAKGSKARRVTAKMLADSLSTKSMKIHPAWLGRTLNSTPGVEATVVDGVITYRLS